MSSPPRIPLLLLKTQSTPTDPYSTHFSTPSSPFSPSFVPVLEHTTNEPNLVRIKTLLRQRRLHEEYGGCIFTSQRAVEGFARVVGEVDNEEGNIEGKIEGNTVGNDGSTPLVHADADVNPFPLYVVGPATALSLHTLVSTSPVLLSLRCAILGAQTGNGESLAHFILTHYNHAHYQEYFTLYEAPRLPFVPLLGMGGSQYSRVKLLEGVRKKGLLFLVGEVRRDVIPRVLGSAGEGRRIQVEEVEVYKTVVRGDFEGVFRRRIEQLNRESHETVVVVVFSPSGCEAMLRVIGRGDGDRNESASENGNEKEDAEVTKTKAQKCKTQFIVAAIGPTTRDHLREKFSFEVHVTARTPSPEGVSEGVEAFLRGSGLLV